MNLARLFRRRDGALAGQVLRYLISGGTAFCVDFGIMAALKEGAGMNAAVAASIGNLAGLIVTYLLSIFWIFSRRRFTNPCVEFLLFFLVGLSGTGLTYVLMYLFTSAGSVHYMVAKLVTVVLVTGWNFVLKKRLLF